METDGAKHVLDIIDVWQLLIQSFHFSEDSLELEIVHLFVILAQKVVQFRENSLVFRFIFTIVQGLVNLIKFLKMLGNTMLVGLLLVLPLDQLLELLDKG